MKRLNFAATHGEIEKYLSARLSVSYTLRTDDITTADKPVGTPYVSRLDAFDGEGVAPNTGSKLILRKKDGGYYLTLTTESEEVSEFGLNLPFNFMGKKNLGGWRNQYLFNSPYSSRDNRHIFCYLSNPNGENLLLLSLGDADGWKMDYSLFLGGQYFDNLKFLYSFDRAYGTKKGNTVGGKRTLRLYLAEVKDYDEALKIAAKMKKVPAAYFERSYVKIGEKLKVFVTGEFDYVMLGRDKYANLGGYAEIQAKKYGLQSVVPYKNGKRGMDCTIFAYDSVEALYKKSMYAVDLADNAKNAETDGNLCEWKCYVSAILRYASRYGKSPALMRKVKDALDTVTCRDESKAVDRVTIFYKAREDYPAYHIFNSRRIQEQFFGVTTLFDAYRCLGKKKYLDYAVRALDCLLENYQKEDGRIETFYGVRCDYTTVCCLIIPVVDAANFFKGKDEKRAERYRSCAEKMAEYLYERGFSFPTETSVQDFAEPFVEEGSMSCTALSLLYYCVKIEKKEKFIVRAKEILDVHDNWEIHTHHACMFHSSLRWWETKWEGDEDGNALCCGHPWTIWRAEADYRYYELTGDKAYLEKAKNGFMSNFSKIGRNGKSYSCYQPDYITGGGFTTSGKQVDFRIVHDFPKKADSGISRYVWIRFTEGISCDW